MGSPIGWALARIMLITLLGFVILFILFLLLIFLFMILLLWL
jgi:hypothetical protein